MSDLSDESSDSVENSRTPRVRDLRDAQIMRIPGWGKRLICPECGRHLPPDQFTECDRCGAHLELKVDVIAPAIDS